MFSKWAIAWLVAVALSGCAIYKISSEVPDQLEELRSQIISGKTSREEVQKRLGEAFIGDERMEVYRVLSGYDVELGGPIIPIVWDTEEVIIYALVIYGENDVVEDTDWAVYQHDRQSISGNTTKWLRSARLHAGEFYFAAFNEITYLGSSRKEFLLASPSLSQNSFNTPAPPGMCAVFVFLKEMEDRKQKGLYLDGDYLAGMPLIDSVYWHWAPEGYWAPYYLNVFAKILVAEGQHELRITTSLKPREFRHTLECKPSKNIYVYPQLKLVESEPWGFWRSKLKYDSGITVDSQPLESYEGWKRLLFYNGKWLGGD